MTRFCMVSVVRFDDGKETEEILTSDKYTADQLHHAHQRQEAKFWKGWKKVVGGRYQVLAARNLVDAMIELHRGTR